MIKKTATVPITFFCSFLSFVCILKDESSSRCCISLGVSHLALSLCFPLYLSKDPTIRDSFNLPPHPKLTADEWNVIQLMNRESD